MATSNATDKAGDATLATTVLLEVSITETLLELLSVT
jgi:hypothetical protein